MTPQELSNLKNLLEYFERTSVTGRMKDRIVDSLRVVERDLKLQTTDYVRGTRHSIPQHNGIEEQS